MNRKAGVSFSSNFRGMGECNAYCFRSDKNVVLGKKKGQLAFSEKQPQLANSGNNISFPIEFSEV